MTARLCGQKAASNSSHTETRPPSDMQQFPLSLAALALFASSAGAQISFQPAQSIPAGTNPDGVAIGDFDGDGDADLAATVDVPDSVVVLANTGGSFSLLSSVATGAGTSPHRLVAGDFDSDGDLDLAVSLQNTNQVRVLSNNGTGGFSLGAVVTTGAEPRDLVVGDVDGDGDLDIASANRTGNSVTVLRNGGAGTFTAQTVGTGQEPRELAVGDFDGDGDLDLAVSAHDDRRVDIVSNQGAAFAVTASVAIPNPHRPDGLTAGDVDGDGDVDLIASSGDDTVLGLNVVLVMSNTGGVFGAPVLFGTGGFNSASIESGDLDLDGDLDLLVANEDSNSVTALANGGAGTFASTSIFAVGSLPTDVVLGDVDGNGSLDAVTPNQDASDLSLLLNTAAGVIASATPRNGSGVNPNVFTSTSLPLLGSTWTSQIDAASTGATGGNTLLVAYQNSFPGFPTAFGELLVDPTSVLLGSSLASVSGGTSDHANLIPASAGNLGLTLSVQTYVIQVRQLTNALDLVLGNV